METVRCSCQPRSGVGAYQQPSQRWARQVQHRATAPAAKFSPICSTSGRELTLKSQGLQLARSAPQQQQEQQQQCALSAEEGFQDVGLPQLLSAHVQQLLASDSPGLGQPAALGLATVLLALTLPDPAHAADASVAVSHAAMGASHAAPNVLGELAENEDFWANVVRYGQYFFSVLLGTAYVATKPIIEAFKKPGTAVAAIALLAGLYFFVSFTVSAMLGITDPVPYEPSSIVTYGAAYNY